MNFVRHATGTHYILCIRLTGCGPVAEWRQNLPNDDVGRCVCGVILDLSVTLASTLLRVLYVARLLSFTYLRCK